MVNAVHVGAGALTRLVERGSTLLSWVVRAFVGKNSVMIKPRPT